LFEFLKDFFIYIIFDSLGKGFLKLITLGKFPNEKTPVIIDVLMYYIGGLLFFSLLFLILILIFNF